MVKLETILQAVVTRSAAWEWMCREYLPAGPICPGCGESITGARALAAWRDLGTVYCAGCGRRFVATLSTPIHQTSWQPEEYLQCLALYAAGRRAAEVAAHIGKSTHAVRDLLDRIAIVHADHDRSTPAPITCSAALTA